MQNGQGKEVLVLVEVEGEVQNSLVICKLPYNFLSNVQLFTCAFPTWRLELSRKYMFWDNICHWRSALYNVYWLKLAIVKFNKQGCVWNSVENL